MSKHLITIVIPTYNRAEALGKTLSSLRELRVPASSQVEVVVIDNNCTDCTPEVVQTFARTAPWPVRHVIEKQQGLCFGRNRGLEEAAGEHVVLLDDDIAISPEWLEGYLDAVQKLNADCVVGPVTPVFDGPVPAFMTPAVVDSIGSDYSRKGPQTLVLPVETAYQVPGCNFGVRRSAARQVGGFDPRLDRVGKGLLAGGDSEFGRQLVRAGKRVVYEPRCAIDHLLVTEKMTKRYIRRRWLGLGATKRAISGSSRFSRPKQLGRIALQLLRSCAWRMRGNEALAFQRELEALRMWGYLRGTPLQPSGTNGRECSQRPESPNTALPAPVGQQE